MIVYDYFLKFDSEEESTSPLETALADLKEDINYSIQKNVYISKQTGNMLIDEDGNQYPETVQVEGYFINIRTLDHKLADLDDYFANAQTYQMMFAGDADFINNSEVL